MQIDFHHAVTYALARLAGFVHADAAVIAHAAQYVDDATSDGIIKFRNHPPYERTSSAHPIDPREAEKFEDLAANVNDQKNLITWALFHFLPGNGGMPAQERPHLPMVDRFICRPDSPLATAMWSACHGARSRPNALHRLGITAHVYADTWAHRGFIGMIDHHNRVAKIQENRSSLEAVVDTIESTLMGTVPLGHGMALCHPDMPFLKWSYTAWDGAVIERDNPRDFLLASERLVQHFGFYRGQMISLTPFDKAVLSQAFESFRSEKGEERHHDWIGLIARGEFSFGTLTGDQLADLDYIAKGPGSWKHAALNTILIGDEDGPFEWSPAFETSHWKAFHDALKDHRRSMLDVILPDFGLRVDDLITAR